MKLEKDTPSNFLDMFDTEAASESGSWLHLERPDQRGVMCYLDKEKNAPCRIKLKGPDSDEWGAFTRKAQKARGKKETRTNKEVALEESKLWSRMTIEIENIPGYEKPDRNALFEMYLKHKDMRQQSLYWVLNQENFIQTAEDD